MNKKITLIEGRELPLSRTTLWRLRRDGKLPFYRVGRRIYYSKKHIEKWLSACEQDGDNNEIR